MRSTRADDYQDVPRPVAVMAKDFAAGAATGQHRHARAQLLYATSGLMIATTDDGTWAVPAGHALLIPPGVLHDVAMHGAVTMRTAYIAAEALAAVSPGCRVLRVSRLLDTALVALTEEPVLYDMAGRGGHLAALVLDEIGRAPETPFALPLPKDPRLRRLCRALVDHPGLDHAIDGWAEQVGMSRRTLTRRFRDETGLSFGAWRRRVRLLEAMTRHAGGRNLREVAATVGYRSPRAFQAMMQRSLRAAIPGLTTRVQDAYDFAVIGAGFFGVRLALLLARRDASVALIDREPRILARASWANQARIHNGYHYPRSLSTAAGSHRHYERFLREMPGAVDESFAHVYAVARDGSATSAAQLERFCRELGLPLAAAPRSARRLLDSSRIEAAFAVREGAFNALALRTQLEAHLAATPAITLLPSRSVERIDLDGTTATVRTDGGPVRARGVFLVAYAGINGILRASSLQPLDLKAELAEICLVDVPPELRGFAFTVIDGPFFSLMPMPAMGTSSLTHVRYTPQASWSLRDDPRPPYALAQAVATRSRFLFMQRDAQRYLPAAAGLALRGSLFELKAIPNRHEIDDGRPILVRCHAAAPLCVSVLGSKIDSVFELEEAVGDLLDGRVPAAARG